MSRKSVKTRLFVIGSVLLAAVVSASGYPQTREQPADSKFETRCGWFVNPTPANIWLYDRDAEWTIGVQGGYQVEGDWDWPKFKPQQWVRTNGNYGYGCACLQVRVDRETQRVLEVKGAQARPLSVCRRDRALRKWKSQLQ